MGAEVPLPMARSRDFVRTRPPAPTSASPRTLLCAPAGGGKTTVLYYMATILGDVTLVITPTLEPAGDQVAKILGRDDLQNIHVIHLNDTETPEHEWNFFLKTALQHYSDLTHRKKAEDNRQLHWHREI
jgi:superfamily II DNA or RNA helicase